MIETPPVIDGNAAVFTLATGEKVRVSLCETGLGLYGFAVKVYGDKSILVRPSASNSLELYTPRSLEAEKLAQERVITERDGAKGWRA